jgi:DNA-binding response OmpR family regulator
MSDRRSVGFQQLSDRLEGKRLGASDYLVRPLRLDAVIRRIAAISRPPK